MHFRRRRGAAGISGSPALGRGTARPANWMVADSEPGIIISWNAAQHARSRTRAHGRQLVFLLHHLVVLGERLQRRFRHHMHDFVAVGLELIEQLGHRFRSRVLEIVHQDDANDAFTGMDRDPPDAILMVSDSLTTLNRKRVFAYAAEKHLPAIYEYDPLVRDGGLMSYGPDLKECFERAAAMVDRIFKGTRPAELPFEQPTHYKFMINLSTAKAIGVEVPPTLLALADEVIE